MPYRREGRVFKLHILVTFEVRIVVVLLLNRISNVRRLERHGTANETGGDKDGPRHGLVSQKLPDVLHEIVVHEIVWVL